MNKLTIGLSLAALAIAGAAQAQAQPQRPQTERRGPDADANGTVTRAEIEAHAAQRFAKSDLNKDGKLDAADRQARRASRVEARFDRLDADDNGQITRDEFGKARPILGRGPAAGRPEARRMMRPGPQGRIMRGPGMRRGMAPMADANNDRAVTQAEFTAAAVQRFERMDANKDGQLTAEERRPARGPMGRRGMRRPAPGA